MSEKRCLEPNLILNSRSRAQLLTPCAPRRRTQLEQLEAAYPIRSFFSHIGGRHAALILSAITYGAR
jgi:hypothetical protein